MLSLPTLVQIEQLDDWGNTGKFRGREACGEGLSISGSKASKLIKES
jgi:hypothetical protein